MKYRILSIRTLQAGLVAISIGVFLANTKTHIPSCDNKIVNDTVIVLWKIQSLKEEMPIQDGRLIKPSEEPIKVSNGRSCSGELVIDGKPNGTMAYSVLAPTAGGGPMVILE